MANWAALQEATHDMPVFKRAKHGIHFKRPDGQIQAEFSGKPCHYIDGGLWKPIDTKLILMPDGYYGCPHSPVRVHADGHVRVDGSDYAQYVELPSASGGLVDGDKIVRTFSFGEQRLWVTEDGFRSEIVLNRIPTLKEARKLVASESGTLSKEYIKSLTTATDANGNSHTFSTLSAFRTWLAQAQFPVTIDPDFEDTPNLYCAWGGILSGVSDYTTAHTTCDYFSYVAAREVRMEQDADGHYLFTRSFIRFDTSSIGSGGTVSQVNLKLKIYNSNGIGSTYGYILKYDWSSYYPITSSNRTTVYAGSLSAPKDDNNWVQFSSCKAWNQYASGNLSTSWINKSGITYYAFMPGDDYDGNIPVYSPSAYNNNVYIDFPSSVLSVTYTAGGNPHYAYAQQ